MSPRSFLFGAFCGGVTATIIVLVAMSRKGAEPQWEAMTWREHRARFADDDWATDAYPAGLVRHG